MSGQNSRWEQASGQQPPPTPPPPYRQHGYPQYGYPQYGYPQYGYPPPQRHTDGTAITVLVLSIASFYVFPLVPAIVALALCPSARRNIESSAGTLTGENLVTAARAISWFNVGLCLLVGVVIAVIAVIAAAVDDTNHVSLALSVLR